MTQTARTLRLDRTTWLAYDTQSGLSWSFVVAMGGYAILAFDRFGLQGVMAPRGTVRMLLVGFYGWLWLAAAVWVIGRVAFAGRARPATVFRLFGYAHLPLVVTAVAIQVFSVSFRAPGPPQLLAAISLALWMPALLVAATSQAYLWERRRALLAVAGPYLVWVLVVGRWLSSQLGHLV